MKGATLPLDTASTAPDVGTQSSRTAGGHAGHRARFDREAAFAFYAAGQPAVTFGRVAAEFGVSDNTVRKWARLERWDERAEALRKAAADKVVSRSLEERNRDAIKVADAASRKMLAQLVDETFRLSGEGWTAIKKFEQLIEERPTEITVHQVSELFVHFVAGLEALVIEAIEEAGVNGKRQAVLAAFRPKLGALIERSAGGLAIDPSA